MLEARKKIVAPIKLEFKAAKTALTEFKRSAKKKSRVFDGHVYTVWKIKIGPRASGRAMASGSPASISPFQGRRGMQQRRHGHLRDL
jgi:hypothetical protein